MTSHSDADSCKVVLFDLGGVIMRLNDPAANFGLELTVDDFNKRWLLSSAVQQFERGHLDQRSFLERVVVDLQVDYGPNEFLRRFDCWPHSICPEALEAVRDIPARYEKAILTNTNPRHWSRDDIQGRVEPQVGKVFLSYESGHVKPDEDSFRQVTEHYRCAPSEVYFVDDNPLNTAAAAALGMRVALCGGTRQLRALLQADGFL